LHTRVASSFPNRCNRWVAIAGSGCRAPRPFAARLFPDVQCGLAGASAFPWAVRRSGIPRRGADFPSVAARTDPLLADTSAGATQTPAACRRQKPNCSVAGAAAARAPQINSRSRSRPTAISTDAMWASNGCFETRGVSANFPLFTSCEEPPRTIATRLFTVLGQGQLAFRPAVSDLNQNFGGFQLQPRGLLQ